MIVETDDGLTGYGEAKGTPVVMKVLVEDVLGPQLVGEDSTRVEFLWLIAEVGRIGSCPAYELRPAPRRPARCGGQDCPARLAALALTGAFVVAWTKRQSCALGPA